MNYIKNIKKEHKIILSSLRRAINSNDLILAKELVEAFKLDLEGHMFLEENILLTKVGFKDSHSNEVIKQFMKEHDLIRKAIIDFQEDSSMYNLKKLENILTEHDEFEINYVLPLIERIEILTEEISLAF